MQRGLSEEQSLFLGLQVEKRHLLQDTWGVEPSERRLEMVT